MNILIGNAWPYANGPLHLGRIAVLLPGDVLARYHRMMGDNVIFLSGTDCHGTPVTMKAEEEKITPLEAVEKYHREFKKCFKSLGFSFDIFEKTHTEYHAEEVRKFILELYEKGYIYEKEVDQTFCEKCNEFLADRNIIGHCPKCGGEAHGYGCTKCSAIFESYEVLDKKCDICGSEPKLIKTKHLFFALSKFENDVKRLYIRHSGWRHNAENMVKRYLDEGLRDRAVTRDFLWGVEVPLEGYEDKRIFVWIEAVMGYLTASMKCLNERGEDWKDYWQGEDSRIYFVHGKDNIPFHAVIFPAILAGLGIKNPDIRIISSEYLKLEGKPFSSVKNWAIWADYITKNYNVDSIRYYLLLNSPENKDTDFTWRDYINTNNNDLAANIGGFANKVCNFIRQNYNSRIPEGKISNAIKDELFDLYFDMGDKIEEGEFKDALSKAVNCCRKYNNYFEKNDPWTLINNNPKKCKEVIYNSLQVLVNLANLLEPFMPKYCRDIRQTIGIENAIWSFAEKSKGTIKNKNLSFPRLDKRKAFEEVERLKEKRI